jgi:hypothetical protein
MIARPSVRALTEWRTLTLARLQPDQLCDLDYAVDGHLELALDHLVNLFLKMKMLVNRRTTFKVFVAVAPACFS